MNALDPITASEAIAPVAALPEVAGAQALLMQTMEAMLRYAGRVA